MALVMYPSLTLLLLLVTFGAGVQGSNGSGTTPNIENIFIGRCHDFQETLDPSVTKNCSDLWESFSKAFVDRGPCDVDINDYDEFAQKATYPLPENMHMFWEGTYEFVYQLTYRGTRYIGVSDILTGFMTDRLVWCGKEGGGIDYSSCPIFGSCPHEGQKAFWQSVSRVFAQEASGDVHVLLNGTTGHAYRRDSIFANYELAYLNKTNVNKLKAFLVHKYGLPVRERCDCSDCSIRLLEADALVRGLHFSCEDNPRDIHFLLCVDTPNAPECQDSFSVGGQSTKLALPLLTIASILSYIAY